MCIFRVTLDIPPCLWPLGENPWSAEGGGLNFNGIFYVKDSQAIEGMDQEMNTFLKDL
jgi:hypothetical protein